MAALVGGASGVGIGGSGALRLGPATNAFSGTTRTAAETARDAYATANASWLAAYDADATLIITVSWTSPSAQTAYQSRRSSAWYDLTAVVRGPAGPTGATGATGAAGAPGMDGNDGADGADGMDGADGADGMDGAEGPEGPRGPAGMDGEDGLLSVSQVDAQIGTALAAAVTGNTETNITVTYNSADGTLDFVVPDDTDTDTLVGLTDTPSSFGTAGQVLAVNTARDGVEWTAQSGGASNFLALSDTPSSFTANYQVYVNAAGTALEFREMSGPYSLTINGRDITLTDGGDGSEDTVTIPADQDTDTFLELTDTPSSYTANRWLKVNAAGDALELTTAPSSATTLLALTDTPSSFGTAGQVLAVNSSATAAEWTAQSGGGNLAFGSKVLMGSVVSYTHDTWVEIALSEEVKADSLLQVRIRNGGGRVYVVGSEFRSWTAHTTAPAAQTYRTAVNSESDIDLARGSSHSHIYVRCDHAPGSTYDIDVEMYPFSSAPTSFLNLSDTPASYTANQWLKVNAAGNALELVAAPSGGASSFLDLDDTPDSYTANQHLAVNAAGDAVVGVAGPSSTELLHHTGTIGNNVWVSTSLQKSSWESYTFLLVEWYLNNDARGAMWFAHTFLEDCTAGTVGSAPATSTYISTRYAAGSNDRKFYIGRRGGTGDQMLVASQGGNQAASSALQVWVYGVNL